MDTVTTHEKVKQLRELKIENLNFKKSLAGGYQCKEVEEYIRNLKSNLEQSKKAFDEKTEEYVSECSVLSQEREKLIKSLKEHESRIKQLEDEVLEKSLHESAFMQENEQLKATVDSLLVKMESNQQSPNKTEIEMLTTNMNELSQINQQLLVENNTLKSSIAEMKKNIEDLKAVNEQKEDNINALSTAKRNHAMDTNMKLYQYKLYLESNMKNVTQNIQELTKVMDLMKAEAIQMYETTKINMD